MTRTDEVWTVWNLDRRSFVPALTGFPWMSVVGCLTVFRSVLYTLDTYAPAYTDGDAHAYGE